MRLTVTLLLLQTAAQIVAGRRSDPESDFAARGDDYIAFDPEFEPGPHHDRVGESDLEEEEEEEDAVAHAAEGGISAFVDIEAMEEAGAAAAGPASDDDDDAAPARKRLRKRKQ